MKKILALLASIVLFLSPCVAQQSGTAIAVDPRGRLAFLNTNSLGQIFLAQAGPGITNAQSGVAVALNPSGTLAYLNVDSTGGLIVSGGGTVNATALNCASVKAQSLTSNTWNTVVSVSGAGVITRLFFSVLQNGSTATPRNASIRITFNGAGTPQFGGSAGIPICQVFGPGPNAPNPTNGFKSDIINCSYDQGTASPVGFVGMIHVPMPFATSFLVECNPGVFTGGPATVYCMAEYTTGYVSAGSLNPASGMVLNAVNATYTTTSLTEQTLWSSGSPCMLLGLWHFFSPPGGAQTGQDFTYLEGKYRIYPNGSGTANYTSSGTEDLYFSGIYFFEGVSATNTAGMVYKNFGNGQINAYRFFDQNTLPQGTSGLKLTWTNGDGAYNPYQYSVTNTVTVFFYQ